MHYQTKISINKRLVPNLKYCRDRSNWYYKFSHNTIGVEFKKFKYNMYVYYE